MELINRKHEDITERTRLRMACYFKIDSDKAIYFSAGAVLKFGLAPGLFIHFQNDDDRWYFYCNQDADGFKLAKLNTHGRNATLVYSCALVNLIRKRTLVSIGTKFPIKLTKSKINNNHLLEIDFSKPYEVSTVEIMQNKQLGQDAILKPKFNYKMRSLPNPLIF